MLNLLISVITLRILNKNLIDLQINRRSKSSSDLNIHNTKCPALNIGWKVFLLLRYLTFYNQKYFFLSPKWFFSYVSMWDDICKILGNPDRLQDYPTRTGKKSPEPYRGQTYKYIFRRYALNDKNYLNIKNIKIWSIFLKKVNTNNVS